MEKKFKNFSFYIDKLNKVFDPSFFGVSYIFAETINIHYSLFQYSSLLSVGCGSGIDFAFLIDEIISKNKQLPFLTFLDIDSNAIENSKLNFEKIC